ncbi:MAG: hypothetical protein AAF528_04135 [Cyanobacteria bacterium P01_C01_bin.121]
MNLLFKVWRFKMGRVPVGKGGVLIAGILLVSVVSSFLPGRSSDAGSDRPGNLEEWAEQIFQKGAEAERARAQGRQEGIDETVDKIFGTSLESALLAELTELDNAYRAHKLLVTDAIVCRADIWYRQAERLAQDEGINPTHYLDTELDARRNQLRDLQTSYGDLRMGAEQFNDSLPLMVEGQAISLALRAFKHDWLAVDAQGNPREPVNLTCGASVFAADGATADYLYQVGARKETEQREQSDNDRLADEVASDEQ